MDEDDPQPPSSDDLWNCPACDWAWHKFGEQACDVHGRND